MPELRFHIAPYVDAVTGFLLFLFVIGHLIGNLQIFLGPEAINRYGHFLQSNYELVWPARIGLLALVALHIWSAAKLSLENRAARPVGFCGWQNISTRVRGSGVASYAARSSTQREPLSRIGLAIRRRPVSSMARMNGG